MKVYISQINSASKTALLASLKNRDRSKTHIVVAPDRCSLSLEQELFDVLGETCFFDISVTSFSRLAKKVLEENSQNKKVLTKHSATAIIKKIILEEKSNFLYFTSVSDNLGFCSEMFETIALLKSCEILPHDIYIKTNNDSLNNKLKDIKLVYEKYEEFFESGFIDSFNQLDLFCQNISKERFGNCCFYFVEFLEFTGQMYNIIEKLARISAQVSIATVAKPSGGADNFYDEEIYERLIQMCFENNFSLEEIKCFDRLESEERFLADNLFAYNKNVNSSNFSKALSEKYSIFEFIDIKDEIRHTLSTIRVNIINSNLRYKNFAIMVPNFADYENLLREQFLKFDMPFYFDNCMMLAENLFIRFVVKLISILNNDYTRQDFIEFLNFPFFDFDKNLLCDIDNFLKNSDTENDLFDPDIYGEQFSGLFDFFVTFNSFKNRVLESATVNDYVDIILDFLKEIDVTSDTIKLNFTVSDIFDAKQLEIAKNKFIEITKDIKNVLGDYACTFDKFAELLNTYLTSANITLPPISADAIFVGDSYNSKFSQCDYLFILGANEGKLPSYLFDIGIISDADILRLDAYNRISPSVTKINKRKRMQVFESLFYADARLRISYCKSSHSQPLFEAAIVSNLKKLLNIKSIDGSSQLNWALDNFYQINLRGLLFNNSSKHILKDNLIEGIKSWDIFSDNKNYRDILSAFSEVLGSDARGIFANKNFSNKVSLVSGDKIFFKNNSASISQFESYYNCPYKYFVRYGLNIKEREDNVFSPREIGNIFHEFVKEILEIFLQSSFSHTKLKITSDNVIEKILKTKYSSLYNNKKNANQITLLKLEGERIAAALLHQKESGTFESKKELLEYRFGYNNKVLSLNLKNNKKVNIVGVIDRVDISGNYFRIIDYKTGTSSSQFASFGELVMGSKIQLFVYLKVFQTLFSHLQPSGVFYMPLTNSFSKSDFLDNYKLSGVISNDAENLKLHDSNWEDGESSVINFKQKFGEILPANFAISADMFSKLADFAVEKMVDAGNSVLSGQIEPKPLKKGSQLACDFCEFKGICNFNESYGNVYRYFKSVKSVEDVFEDNVQDTTEEDAD